MLCANPSETLQLIILKELVALHGGKLLLSSRAESEYPDDPGSVFTVMIPLGSKHLPPNMVSEQTVPDAVVVVNKATQDIE